NAKAGSVSASTLVTRRPNLALRFSFQYRSSASRSLATSGVSSRRRPGVPLAAKGPVGFSLILSGDPRAGPSNSQRRYRSNSSADHAVIGPQSFSHHSTSHLPQLSLETFAIVVRIQVRARTLVNLPEQSCGGRRGESSGELLGARAIRSA